MQPLGSTPQGVVLTLQFSGRPIKAQLAGCTLKEHERLRRTQHRSVSGRETSTAPFRRRYPRGEKGWAGLKPSLKLLNQGQGTKSALCAKNMGRGGGSKCDSKLWKWGAKGSNMEKVREEGKVGENQLYPH
ncbi:hypothetical protein E2C01_052688 [Portunus trituberculatus]|uniref:Uncharacterized protein n=1 Tax=Portunus trituberculatus TaxID=210409 RepID=A0A5B7GFB0_PORTR|nr:hypothetical protein [Portunus trituberculatus]